MELSAEYVVTETAGTITALCSKFTCYTVLVVGHSLGGGTATLVTRAWMDHEMIAGPPHRPKLHGFSFGPPCVVSKYMSAQLERYVTSVGVIRYASCERAAARRRC